MSHKIVSLFSGAGGLDLGFEQAGFDIVFANDVNENVKETYDKNHDSDLIIQDIQDIDPENIPECDGIIGGPPCQSWSLAGNLKGADDERGEVFHDYIDIIEAKEPKFFVTENVPGIVSQSNADDFKEIKNRFENMGYKVQWKKVNSAYYNVPQRRKRVIIVGFREDMNVDYSIPSGSDEEMTQEDSILDELPTPVREEENEPEINSHEYYVGDYSSRFMSRNRVRSWAEPAYTVQANARHQKIHPQAPKMVKIKKDNWKFKEGHESQYRRYSVREAAILQTFPMEFEFLYDDINTGYKMVGNAVPVNLAYEIAISIGNQL